MTNTIEIQKFTLWDKLMAKRAPLAFDIEITARCNMNCAHCYINLPAGDKEAQASELTAVEILTIARSVGLERVEAEFIGEQEAAIKMFAFLGFTNLLRLEDYVKDMQAISHDYVLMAVNLKVDEEYAGVGG